MRWFVLSLFAAGVPVALGAAAVVTLNHLDNRSEFDALTQRGQRAEASVVKREKLSDRRLSLSGRHHLSMDHLVTYRYDRKAGSHGTLSFTAALEGSEQELDLTFDDAEFRIPVDKALYDAAGVEGHRETIIFLPDAPEVVRLVRDDGTFDRPSGVPWAVGLVFLAGLSGLLFHQYRTTGRTM